MKYAVIDKTMDKAMKNIIAEQGYILVETIICENIQESLKYHPDMQICRIDKQTIVVEPSCYSYYRDIFHNTDINVIKGKTVLTAKYPSDIAYNVLVSELYAFHNFKYTDKIILEELSKRNIKLLNINQGYSKCSIMLLPNGKLITEDQGISKTSMKYGIDIFNITNREVELSGYDCGFIGGASSQGGELIFLTGSLSNHSYGNLLKEYISDIKTIELSNKKLYDYGSIIILG